MAHILTSEEIDALLDAVEDDNDSFLPAYDAIKQNEFYVQIGTEFKKVKQPQSIKDYMNSDERRGFITNEDILNDLKEIYNKDLRNVFKDKKEAIEYYKKILEKFNYIKDDIKAAKSFFEENPHLAI